MTHRFADIAFTDAVKDAQTRYGTRSQMARMAQHGGPNDRLGARETEFIAARDSFYIATVSETGWPYLQHRGGPAGFLRVVDARTLAFAEFAGNRQFVTVGNAARNDRASLFLMDYANRRRLKLLGHLTITDFSDAPPALAAQVALPGYVAQIERLAVIRVAAFDWNCPQHITPRHTAAEWHSATQPLRDRIAALERELAELRAVATGQ
jgi:predicted pyridoxine 5'-phosphate oxidase superfamily flavin-nucleotide-binding protein